MRVSFAGGGSDLEEFSKEYGGAVVNSTVSIFAHVKLTNISSKFDTLISKDLGIEKKSTWLNVA